MVRNIDEDQDLIARKIILDLTRQEQSADPIRRNESSSREFPVIVRRETREWLREDTGSTIGRKRENHGEGKLKGNDRWG